MKRHSEIYVVIPTRAILAEFQPAETLLSLAETTPRDVLEMYLSGWVEHRALENTPGFVDLHLDARTHHTLSARLIVTDLLFDVIERREEQAWQKAEVSDRPARITETDRRDLERVLMQIWALLSEELFPLFEELNFTSEQIDRLRFVRWTGDDIIVAIPRARGPKPV